MIIIQIISMRKDGAAMRWLRFAMLDYWLQYRMPQRRGWNKPFLLVLILALLLVPVNKVIATRIMASNQEMLQHKDARVKVRGCLGSLSRPETPPTPSLLVPRSPMHST